MRRDWKTIQKYLDVKDARKVENAHYIFRIIGNVARTFGSSVTWKPFGERYVVGQLNKLGRVEKVSGLVKLTWVLAEKQQSKQRRDQKSLLEMRTGIKNNNGWEISSHGVFALQQPVLPWYSKKNPVPVIMTTQLFLEDHPSQRLKQRGYPYCLSLGTSALLITLNDIST